MFFLLLLTLVGSSPATTLEVLSVYQPLSLHGTDIDHEFEGEAIQAQIFSTPFVLSGAMPENLVAAIAKPHRLPGPVNYDIKESNLLVLYQVGLEAHFSEQDILIVTFDLSKMSAPDKVELPIRTVLRLSIAALKKSLSEYHHAENEDLKVRVEITGTNEKNQTLKDLDGSFTIKG
jgi:hypothetical protein